MKKSILNYFRILVEHEIVRRYIIINSFDGALTILGIVVAVFMSGIKDPKLIIIPSIGASIAMCVSGIWGSYAAERAEIKKKIRVIEAHLIKDLSGTEFSRQREKMAWIIGVVDGIIPLILAFILIFPFFFVPAGYISIQAAYYLSLALVAVNLFVLGAFAGKIAKESMIKQGVIMLLAGVVIGLIFIVLAWLGVI
ncbi:VIT1/CCC1 transporter family protein [Candidatus Woesearchaeota archaeon]|jgi:predicted membrane protein (TIGR00267 family)|nr:VIT1/CCC1 transporter family protein [Candidatus Woesearchaeota archaeon]